jgi:transcription factor C subunit 7
LLRKFFPTYSQTYRPTIIPSRNGETIDQLHDRCAYAMSRIIADLEAEEPESKAVLLCTHAASLIAIGRVLTGNMPEDANEEDFKPFTCGLSMFVRRSIPPKQKEERLGVSRSSSGDATTRVDWRHGNGVAGGWDCVLNGDCSFLDGGEERGW